MRRFRKRSDRFEAYADSAAVRGKDLIYSGDVDNRLFVFLWDNLLKAGIRFAGDASKAKEGRRLVICSEGGDADVMTSIIDLFEEVDDLTTVATGTCMSAAVPIVAAGTPGMRFATHRTRFMIHTPWDMFDFPLSAVDMTAETNECVQMLNEYAKIMHRYCNNTLEWWNKKLSSNKNWYFDADQALKLGIIDHIIPDQIKGKVRKVKRPKKKHT